VDFAFLLVVSTPLILAALGEVVGQRGGVLNIGVEGMMLFGAFFGFLATGRSGSLLIGFGAAVLVGVVLALISGLFTVRLGADQVVVGTAINFLALGVTGLGFRRIYGQSGQLLSSPSLPHALGIDPIVVIALLLIPAIWFLLMKTNWGLALRASGEYPKAVEAAGFSVSKVRISGLVLGGALAGLAGAHLSLGVAGTFAEGMTAGRGFLAIALVTFGRWQPIWVALAALLLGYTQSLQYSLQGNAISRHSVQITILLCCIALAGTMMVKRKADLRVMGGIAILASLSFFSLSWPQEIHIPSQLWLALPYVLALLVLVLVGSGTLTPRALGKPYEKEA